MQAKHKLLYVTDLHYQANDRIYHEEDIYLSSQLSKHFDLVLCQPLAAVPFINNVDVVLFRNTGPVMYFAQEYNAFRKQAKASKAKVFNELTGKADMEGKQYLVDLFQDGHRVIPSIDNKNELNQLPSVNRYISKLKHGSDSIGMEYICADELENIDITDKLIQPLLEFSYEVSFYFINHDFQYALYAPKPDQRWKLKNYDATQVDLDFASKFINWNDINYGIQRIDACRMPDGDLLLMEIEDINPFLSLDLLKDDTRNNFIENLSNALINYVTE